MKPGQPEDSLKQSMGEISVDFDASLTKIGYI
jgi:hypothetical protein